MRQTHAHLFIIITTTFITLIIIIIVVVVVVVIIAYQFPVSRVWAPAHPYACSHNLMPDHPPARVFEQVIATEPTESGLVTLNTTIFADGQPLRADDLRRQQLQADQEMARRLSQEDGARKDHGMWLWLRLWIACMHVLS